MASPEENLSKKTKDLKIQDETYINILLLGETGVGKSTFINSTANYLTYSDFKKAEKEKLITLIPSKCKVQDKHGKDHLVHIGAEDDQNECLDTGKSATQDVKSYVFPIWNGSIKVRLIDTPGIGDCRGVDQDNVNCESILSYIGQLHELHAICFLFKPTNPRITVYFEYCMTQILSRLDKSASKNIIFIFTNTRGTDYSPGETFPSLQKVIDDIKNRQPQVEIPMKKNVFCFDNESYRFLAAVKEKIEFESFIKERNYESWKKSVEQCNKLIKYILGDATNPPLKPHFIKSTSAINEARRLIVQLSQPLAEISQLINDNIYALHRHQDNLNLDSNTLDQLKQKLYMPVIDLDVTKLTQPVTVCASKKCSEVYKVEDLNKWHYKQRCHDPCYLTNVPKEIVGSPELINCAAINSTTRACNQCQCDFSTHMHIYYITKTVENRVVDKNVKKNIDTKEKLLENTRILLKNMSTKKDELENEHKIIVRTCAKFAHFLQNNAITPFSDSYKEYIEYMMMRERSLGALSKMAVIHHLQVLLKEYEASKQSFNEALSLQKKIGEGDAFITPQKIQDSIQDLYKLKHNGKKIKELYECQKKSRSKEHKNSEYVHEVLAQLEEDRSTKEKKGFNKYVNKNTNQQKKQQQKANQGNQRDNSQQRGRNRSQTRWRTRDQSPPPPYQDLGPRRDLNRSHGPQYHHQDYSVPSRTYRAQGPPGPHYYPPDDYPHPGNPGSHYGPQSYSPHHSYRDAPPPRPDYMHYDPNTSNPRYDRKDVDRPRKNSVGSDSYEVKVVLSRQQRDQPEPARTIPPPQPAPRDHYAPEFHPPPSPYHPPPSYYPPPASPYAPPASHYSPPPAPYPSRYEIPHRHDVRPFDNYHNRGREADRPAHDQRQPGSRPNERTNNNNRGRGGYYGRGGGQKTVPQKFKSTSHKKKVSNTKGSSTDSDSD